MMIERRVLSSALRRLGIGNQPIRISRNAFAASKYGFSRRVSSASVTSGYCPPKAAIYPERLLVYHAGTAKVVFIGCLKINTIFLFSFSCLVLAPSYYLSPDWSNWTMLAVIIGGAIPMIFVTYTTAPFVSYVHLKLPGFARRSQEQLMQWVQNLPRNTEIDVTTLRFSGGTGVSRMLLSDLKETKARLGIANLARVSNTSISSNRPWWLGKEPDVFYVAHDSTKGRKSRVWQTAPWQQTVWQHILDKIRKQ